MFLFIDRSLSARPADSLRLTDPGCPGQDTKRYHAFPDDLDSLVFSVVANLDTGSASSARDLPKAIALAKASGYRETVLFEKRQRRTEILR